MTFVPYSIPELVMHLSNALIFLRSYMPFTTVFKFVLSGLAVLIPGSTKFVLYIWFFLF